MERDQIIGAAKKLVRANRSFVLATVDEKGAPHVRWMGAAYMEEPFTLYLATAAASRKMGQIKSNPRSQLMFQNEDFSQVATLTGDSSVVVDGELKHRVWDAMPEAHAYFSGPDDPVFGVIKFECRRVEVTGLVEGMVPVSAEL
jgi:general stress protein 26